MVAVTSRKKARIEKQAVQIPEDVAMEILKRLPVKSLLRFSCACKTWYSLIPDPCNKILQKIPHLLICRRRPNTFSAVAIEESLLMNEKPLSLPWQPEPEPGSKTKFLGSCNGLVCVYHTSSCPDRSGLILWNPSTRKFRKLPPATRVRDLYNRKTYSGFGYDESVGDYKFVWMVIEPERIEFDVFSLKSKAWSSFHHPQPSDIILSGSVIHREHPGVLSNGAIHWILFYYEIAHKFGFRICAFDLASQTFRLLEFPQECEWNCKVVLVSLSGFLCFLYTRNDMAGCCWIDLWMMKEYGVDSSWTIMASLPTTISIHRDISLYEYHHTIHFSSEEGNIVAMAEHREGCQIMRLRVKEGVTVSYETLLSLSEKADTIVFEKTFSIP